LGVRVLGCWGVGVLGCWGVGVLGCWGVGVLGCWGVGVFGCSGVGVLVEIPPLPHSPTSPLPHFPKKIKSARFQENISLPPSARVSIVGYYARKLLSNLGRISI